MLSVLTGASLASAFAMGVAKPSDIGLCKSTPGDCECTGELLARLSLKEGTQ